MPTTTSRRTTTTTTRSGGATADGAGTTRGRSPQPRLGQRAPEIQEFGTLRLLPIALSAEARTDSCQILNQILADTTILYAMYKKHHWLVAGPTFYQLHLLFDKHAEEQLELVDLLAQRVQSPGGTPRGGPEPRRHPRGRPPPRRGADDDRAAARRRRRGAGDGRPPARRARADH